MKKLILFLLISAFGFNSFAQDEPADAPTQGNKSDRKEARRQKVNAMIRQAEEGVLVYRKQSIFGIQAKTNGYGVFYELGRMKSNRKTNIYRIDITETKSHTEENG